MNIPFICLQLSDNIVPIFTRHVHIQKHQIRQNPFLQLLKKFLTGGCLLNIICI